MADDRLPDEALVVRGGCPPYDREHVPFLFSIVEPHPDDPFGFSVQSEMGRSLEELGGFLSNRTVGVTTVGEIRRMGYDVVRTSGEGRHATVVVPIDGPKTMPIDLEV